jgi:hypothetical protein
MVLLNLLCRPAGGRVPLHLSDVEAPTHEVRWDHNRSLGYCLYVSCNTEKLCRLRSSQVSSGIYRGRCVSGLCDHNVHLVSEERACYQDWVSSNRPVFRVRI